MTMVMSGYEDNEPLRPTNIKPNLSQLRIVKEEDLSDDLAYSTLSRVSKLPWDPFISQRES